MSTSPFKAGGALTDENATIYIERQADRDALTHLRAMDYLLLIEPRQQGKTSLINHLMRHPALGDVSFAYADVTTPNRSTEAAWYQTLCPRILRQLRGCLAREQWPAIPAQQCRLARVPVRGGDVCHGYSSARGHRSGRDWRRDLPLCERVL